MDSAPLVSETLQADDLVETPVLTEPKAPTHVSLRGMTLNLVTGGLGSGILTLAWGMAGASVAVALVSILLVVALNGLTVMLLVHAAEMHKKFDLGSLLSMLPGRWPGSIAQGVCNVLVWFTMWLSLMSYMIIIQDCLTSLFSSGSVFASRSVWALLSSLAVLPLSWMDLEFLSRTSSPLSVIVNFYLFGLLCVGLASEGISSDGVCLVARLDPPPKGTFAFLSLISNTIIIQVLARHALESVAPCRPGVVASATLRMVPCERYLLCCLCLMHMWPYSHPPLSCTCISTCVTRVRMP